MQYNYVIISIMIDFLSRKYKPYKFYIQISLITVLLFLLYFFLPVNTKSETFYLHTSKPSEIIETLKKHNYPVTALDKILLSLLKIPQKGWYTTNTKYKSRLSFFSHLHQMKTDALMHIVIYAGETKEEIGKRLANDTKLSKEKLLEHYNRLSRFKEGDILADRYKIARKAKEYAVIQYLFDISSKRMKPYEKIDISIGHKKRDLRELLIIASIIQKESNSVSEMPLISAVIHNRLNKNMYLQMDATLNYGPYAHSVVDTSRIKYDTSAYNTYKHKGIPPHPLCAVTLQALHATIHPADKPYLFFMLTPTGTHSFSQTYKEHLQKIALFREYRAKQKQIKLLENNESNISNEPIDTDTFKSPKP